MSTLGGGTDKSAKHVLDEFGQQVYEQVKNGEAKTYFDELHGDLSEATYPGDENPNKTTPPNPCLLQYDYNSNVTIGGGREYPCKDRPEVRFSDEYGGQCTDSKIKGNEDNKGGACAPFRRLFLCDQHLSHMKAEKINNKHNLLLEVCLAAKYEGESLKGYHDKYNATYSDSRSQLCTVLARSFADIGDIIRGKDLFIGYDKKDRVQKKKLQDSLKNIFGNIYNELTTSGKNVDKAKARYNDPKGDFFQLREDWWALNREKVWSAITCNAQGNKYFRPTCSGGESIAHNKCTCINGDPPTYFDYVPQYLRWFEEWAEDFCRKRKHKLQNAKEQCRGKNGEDKYCDLNGYDCKRTISAEKKLFPDSDCNKCSYSCIPFRTWIDNQKLEFLKQKNKYDKEKEKNNDTTKTTRYGPINNLYAKDFYDKLKQQYITVDSFLELLNKEKECKNHPEVGDGKKTFVDFSNKNVDETFSRTEICEPCPWCGIEKQEDGKWKRLNENAPECPQEIEKTYPESNTTDIPVLTPEKGKTSILQKYRIFCQNAENNKQIKEWQCHYEKNDKSDDSDETHNSDNCILGKWENFEKGQEFKSYYSFFYGSIIDMLKDSVDWRDKLNNCINNETKACKNGCNKNCDCYKRWVEKKQQEWSNIKKHFGKQGDLLEEIKGEDPGKILEFYLKSIFLQDMKEAQGDPKAIKRFTDLLQKKNNPGTDDTTKTIIDKFLQEELTDANRCKETHKDDCSQQEVTRLRSADPSPDTVDSASEDEDEEDKDHQEETEDTAQDTGQGEEETATEKVAPTVVDVCATVAEALTKGDLNAACTLKYGTPNRYWGWKCIGDKTATGEARAGRVARSPPETAPSSAKSGEPTGSICIPPRRRRLYIQKLHEWASRGGDEATKSQSQAGGSEAQPQGGEKSPSGKVSSQSDKLRTAFIQSAAIETFFLWHKYKAENTKTQSVGSPLLLLPQLPRSGSDDKDPETSLKSGTIPIDFLRLMFYTIADYKDIFEGKNMEVVNLLKDGSPSDKEMQERESKIKDAIDKVFPNSDNKKHSGVPSQTGNTTPQTLWSKYAEPIWNGMICALTYRDSEEKGGTPTQNNTVKTELYDKNTKENGKYNYHTVTLEDDSDETRPKIGTSPSGEKTYLSKFVLRPPYFRYLEEWGETFCRERTRRLEKIQGDCTQGDDEYKCSGYGENCKDIREQDYSIISNFNCPDCGKSCRSYKKWINIKKDEFTKHSNVYNEQKEKAKNNKDPESKSGNISDHEFVGKLDKDYASIDSFLEKLGSCSKNNKDNGDGTINFKEPDVTFKPADNCKPCSEFKVNCRNGNCKGANGNTCNGETVTAEEITKMSDSTVIDIRVSDNSENVFEDILDECQNAGIFEGIRKEQWTCGYVCGVDICEQTNVNVNQNDKEYIQIRALLKRWVDHFLEDYIKIKHKISHCIDNGKGNICKNKCNDKCNCASKWIDEKRTEWKTIRDRYFEQYKGAQSDVYDVKGFLEDLQSQIPVTINKAIEPCKDLGEFERSTHCNGAASSENGKPQKKDIIECLLDKLEKKTKKCKDDHPQPSAENQAQTCENSAHVEDDDEPLEEEGDQNPVGKQQPSFCPPVEDKKKEEEGETCTPASPAPAPAPSEDPPVPAPAGDQKEASTPKVAPRPKPPRVKPQQPGDDPWEPLKNAMLSSTIMWSIGIGFATFTYFYLKKKTKSSVGNLFQILQIPKGDYDIPTLKSSNRYIPYASDRYKGKTYIYMEGDSSGDEKYAFMSDTTDVTSSESEYEELDINDIYVPGSPKYKTLIEVVLEPSKRDIPSGDIPHTNKFTDNEWNQLKKDFISNMLQNTQNTEPNVLHDNVDNNTHPTMSRHNVDQKPFIMSIHDRNLYIGEEYSYDMSTNSGENNLYSGIDPTSANHDSYSGIDLINDALNGDYDIYDEILKRKENELFGTNHTKKNTSTNSVAKNTNSDPILNQINLFHKWLDRHRNMCEQWDKNKKEEFLDKLKKEWNKENNNNSGDINNRYENVLNTDVSIQIDMHNPKPKNEFTNMDTNPDNFIKDTILNDLEKHREPYFYDIYDDDITYFDTDDVKPPMDDIHIKEQTEMNALHNNKMNELLEKEYPISDIWNI
ncbi:hypothetical protein PFNF54_02096 [Plasmodium falciparum NF54]|uniref:Erythrocyte membrane protein 1 n=1 Tax=Plasmodium falciparum (isolate NF54) TaxID=5843 RepID=W7JWX7_PLAFO|nr:hypothetical protein PFNF54_02096 [Plasmodium falciparum NF54]